MTKSKPISECQICGSSPLGSILFLGYIPPVNTMHSLNSLPEEQPAYPLEMIRCGECGHVQIGLEVDVEELFPYSYPYLSGTTRILRENFSDLYNDLSKTIELGKEDLIVDIGSNDGTLLSNFKDGGHRVLGVEPSQAGMVAKENDIETMIEYFDMNTAQKIKKDYGLAKVITAANVFAHIAKPHDLVDAIDSLLMHDGVFVSESHYLVDLVDTLQYDTIYHEHLRYYHLGSLIRLLGDHGFEVFDIKKIPTHGGSIRVYAARAGTFEIQASVSSQLEEEDRLGITDGSGLIDFRTKVVESKLNLYKILADIKRENKAIFGVGAPSRASTLINYTGLDDGIIDCVMEVSSSHKLDKYIPGTRIPVLDEKCLFERQPDYALILSWHIADELMGILRKKGFLGKFIIPLPEPHVVD